MKIAISSSAYTFNTANSTINFTGVTGFTLNKLYGIIDQTTNQILYAPSVTGYGYSSTSGTNVTLQVSMVGVSNTDTLMVLYDDSTSTIGAVTGSGTAVEVIPTVTASTYTSGFVVGGIMTFANALPAGTFNGVLESITLKFKASVQTGSFAVALFTASPTGTYTDHAAPTFGATDNPLLLGIYKMTSNTSSLGTHTIYNLDNINKQIVGSSTSIYAVVIATATSVAMASTSDMSLQLGIIK